MNGIDTDVVAIQDSKTCGNDLAVFVMEAQTVSLRMARYMEGTTLRWIGFVVLFKSKGCGSRNQEFHWKKHIGDRRIQNGIV